MGENTDNIKLVEVYNGSRWEAEIIKGLLESSDIDASIKDGLMSSFAPYISPTVSVMVNADQYAEAIAVLRSRDKEGSLD